MSQLRLTEDSLWGRIGAAVEKVRERLRRVSMALESAGIPFAIVGESAVQIWVAQVDESVVRNTQDVDVLIERNQLNAAIQVLQPLGFRYRVAAGVAMFLDGPDAKARDSVHVIFAGEKVRDDHLEEAPDLSSCRRVSSIPTVALEELVRMKLTSFRRKDQVHLLDMLSVGLIDEDWRSRFSTPLGDRLQELIDDPEG